MKKYLIIFLFLSFSLAIAGAQCESFNGSSNPFDAFSSCDFWEDKVSLGEGWNPDFNIQEKWSSLENAIEIIMGNLQIITALFAIGAIVVAWFMLVFPTKEETKKTAKSFVIYACLGFFLAIAAEIIINGLVDIWYSVFSE